MDVSPPCLGQSCVTLRRRAGNRAQELSRQAQAPSSNPSSTYIEHGDTPQECQHSGGQSRRIRLRSYLATQRIGASAWVKNPTKANTPNLHREHNNNNNNILNGGKEKLGTVQEKLPAVGLGGHPWIRYGKPKLSRR